MSLLGLLFYKLLELILPLDPYIFLTHIPLCPYIVHLKRIWHPFKCRRKSQDPYDLTKSEAASTKVVLPIRLGKILNINLIESLEGKLQQHRCEVWMVRYSPNTA